MARRRSEPGHDDRSGPLRHDEALALAEGFLSTASHFAQECVERAGGNPLFLEQLLHHAEGEAEGKLPPSLQSLVLARVDRLAAQDRAAIQAASVIGQHFTLDVLRVLLDTPDYGASALLAHLLVRPERDGFLFAHALIRDGIYASLTKPRRQPLHRRAASIFQGSDPALRAEHLDRADDAGAPAAYLEAATAQADAFHQEKAMRLADRGLALARSREDRLALGCLLGDLRREAGDGNGSLAVYEQARSAAASDVERCRVLLGVAAAQRLLAGVEPAMVALAEAEPIALALGHDRDLAEILYQRGNLHFARGELEACALQHQLALDAARRAGAPEAEARAASGLADADYAHGRMRTALGHFVRCVELCETHGFARIAVASQVMIGHCRIYLNAFDHGLEDMRAAWAAAVTLGNRHAEMFAMQSCGLLLTACARYDDAATYQEPAIELARQLGARRYQAIILAHQAETRFGLGDRGAAASLAEEAWTLSQETGTGFCGPFILGVMARIAEGRAEQDAALAEGEALLAQGCISHNHFWFRRHAIESALQAGAWTEAERHADALDAYTRAEPLPYSDLLIGRARALSALGQGRRDAATLDAVSRLRAEADRVGLRIAFPAS